MMAFSNPRGFCFPGHAWAAMCLLAAALTLQIGCGARTGGGPLTAFNAVDDAPARLTIDAHTSAYIAVDQAEASFLVQSAAAAHTAEYNEPGRTMQQTVRVTMLWRPRAGATPMDATATNASLHWIVRVDDEVGVYAGAGYALVQGHLGRGDVSVRVTNGSLRLVAATDGFRDPVTPATVTGSFTAEYDPALYAELLSDARDMLTQQLGNADALPRGFARERAESARRP